MKFQFSRASKSRLMGSIGIHMRWIDDLESLDQFFLLDTEDDGIVDYVGLRNASEKKIFIEEKRLMGGLGSKIINLTRKETFNLLYNYGTLNIKNNNPMPEPLIEYGNFLKKDVSITDEELLSKICTKITDPVEFINYLSMRFVANDTELLNYFSYYKEKKFDFLTNSGSTLLYNSVEKIGDDTFIASSIVEEEDGYFKLKLGFSIIYDGRYFFRSILGSKRNPLSISDVTPFITREEYIALFHHNLSNLSEKLISIIPSLFKVPFDQSILFTEFNKNNNHVKNKNYRISDDIVGLYLVKKHELVFVALDLYHYHYGMNILNQLSDILLTKEFHSTKPIIYEYAKSNQKSMEDFLMTIES